MKAHCGSCHDRGWKLVTKTRNVLRYVGDFGNDERPAKEKWRLNGPQEEVTIEEQVAEPCSSCNSNLYQAHVYGRLQQVMRERDGQSV